MHMTLTRRAARAVLLAAAVAIGLVEVRGAERLVLVEKYSASWCPHCASASQDLADLRDAYPEKFVTFDAFSATDGRYWTDWGVDRAFEFYSLQSYPTTVFDGVSFYAGSTDAYSIYEEAINLRASAPTDVALNMTAHPLGGGFYDVTTSVTLEEGGVAKTMRIQLARALDHYGVYDTDAVVPHNTVMEIVETGHDVSLVPGETVQFTRTFQLESASWPQFEDVRLIAWAQAPIDLPPAEVYNAAQALLYQANPADYNDNGFINGTDVDIWADQFGTSTLPMQGADGTGDGAIDGADFLLLQRFHDMRSNRPSTAVAGATASAAPEPNTLLLAMASLALGAKWLRKRLPKPQLGA